MQPDTASSRGTTPCAVYTFGMPRVGGKQFAGEYNPSSLGAITYRLVHGDDIVPRVPPPELGYRHVGCVLQCASESKFAIHLRRCLPSDRMPQALAALFWGDSEAMC